MPVSSPVFIVSNIELSVIKKLTDSFTSPPNNPDTGQPYLATPYNVYNEDKYQDDRFVPTFPFVFLLASRVPPKETRLPVMILDITDLSSALFEIGTRRGAYQLCQLHIFARNRGERNNLAGYVRQVFTDYPSLPIYDFTPPTPTVLYTTMIEGISVRPMTIAPDIGIQGSLNNWMELSFEFQVRS